MTVDSEIRKYLKAYLAKLEPDHPSKFLGKSELDDLVRDIKHSFKTDDTYVLPGKTFQKRKQSGPGKKPKTQTARYTSRRRY